VTIITGKSEQGFFDRYGISALLKISGERGDLASDEHTNFAAELISSSKAS
jgi:hypothetical protein